jgi:hypothetical protein
MNSTNSYDIEVWEGNWGLPSVNVDCLKILVSSRLLTFEG